MLSPLIAAMLGAAASFNYSLPPAPRRSAADRCSGQCANRYRVPADADDGVTPKYRALADDGTKCNVVGAKRCTSGGHRLWRTRFGD